MLFLQFSNHWIVFCIESPIYGIRVNRLIHPYAKVLAMFAFDSYSQSKPALPWITGSETMTICRIPAHRHGSVEMIIPALCRSTRKQQQQQPSNQQPQQQQDPVAAEPNSNHPKHNENATSKIKALC